MIIIPLKSINAVANLFISLIHINPLIVISSIGDNIAIAILEKLMIGWNYFVFWW